MEWKKESVRDETGEGFETATCEELVMPVKFLEMEPETRLQAIKDFKYMDGDILVCSYPKTGSHWVYNLIHFLMNPGPVEQMLTVAPKLIDLSPLEYVEQQTPPRLMMSHLIPARLPREHLEKGGKIVLIARNPRDTMISHMYQTQKHDLFAFSKISWNAFFEYWINGKIPTGSFFEYYGAWKKEVAKNTGNVLVVHYENLVQNGLHEMRRLQTFLGLDNPNERLQQIMDRCALDRLKQDIDSGKTPFPHQVENGAQLICRKGIVGDWKNHFTVAQSERFTEIEEENKDSMFIPL